MITYPQGTFIDQLYAGSGYATYAHGCNPTGCALQRRELVERVAGHWALTPAGRQLGRERAERVKKVIRQIRRNRNGKTKT